jgi:tetratricopeptide (TPR) repeat protein
MIESKSFTNPFPGLRPFETDEYRLFFGREGQSDSLITRLQRSRFLAVVGTSGSGKSSLVRAGLLPALRGGMMAGAGSGWRICIMRPGSDPIGNLALALADKDVLLEAGGGLPPAEAEAVIEATLRRGSLGLVEVARQARLAAPEKLLVVVDQFEELFRFRAARASSSTGDDASAFVKLLLEASQQSELSIYVVPTMRSDFLGDCAQFQGLPEAINEGQYLIPRMTRDERRFAITGPVGVTRGKITEPLVNRLMNDVGDNPDQLPILQHALMRTWDHWAAHRRNGEPIGLEHYEAVGTMSNALSKHADEAFDELPDERSRLITEVLFKALTERGADNREIRRPTCLKDICVIANATAQEVVAVIEVFRGGGRSFLMPPAGVALEPETVIDISHESLIRNWVRLMGWVKDEADSARIYRRLAGAATDYHAGAGGLLDDVTLQYVLRWREKSKPDRAWGVRYHPEFDNAMAYLEESTAARDSRIAAEQERERRELDTARAFAEKQQRAARRMRWLTAGMAVMFVLALAAAAWGFDAQRKATNSARTAREEQAKAEESARVEKREEDRAKKSEQEAKKDREEAKKSAQEAMKAQDSAVKSAQHAQEAQASAENSRKEAEASNARLTNEKKKTDDALNKANENLIQGSLSVDRSNYNMLGTAAFRREDYSKALDSFSQAFEILKQEQARSVNQEKTDKLGFTQVSLLSNLGATQRKLGEADKNKLTEAVNSYEEARKILDIVTRDEDGEWTLFDVLYGEAHAYKDRATSAREEFYERLRERQRAGNVREQSKAKLSLPNEVISDFATAEGYFKQALAIQEKLLQGKDPGRLAGSYQELARGYLETGRFEPAEAAFKRVVELRRLDSNERAALAAALRELGEFYRGLEGHYDDAVRVFNEMITLQEDISVEELAHEGQAIANSYVDLGQIHAAKGNDEKAEDAFRVAKILQRTAFMLQQKEKVQKGSPRERAVNKELNGDLDELGDAFIKLGKFNDAEVLYVTALSQRAEDGSDLEKSYEKLTTLYRRGDLKDPAKAEEYNKLLIKFYEDKPLSAQYADALVQLAALYSEDPNKYSEAESNDKHALDIYAGRHDWQNENLILFRLARLYDKQKKVPEREQALRARVDTLTKYFNQLANPAGPPPKDPALLVSEYLYAINALAYFYDGQNTAEAEATYRRAFAAYDYITGNIYNEKTLKFYAATLEDYQKLLKKLGKQAETAKVDAAAAIVRKKLDQSDQIRKQQQQQIPTQSNTAP